MVITMELSELFKNRIDECSDRELLQQELDSLYHIMFRNKDNVDIRLEMIEKIKYITLRINELDNSPSRS